MNHIQSSSPAPIHRVQHGASLPLDDKLAVEEPLEIRLGYGLERTRKSISITMRTPGHDGELAAGFLFTEGLVKRPEDINAIEPCGGSGNVIRVDLHESVSVDLKRLERHFYTSSSCGVCGKSSLEALKVQSDPVADNGLRVPAELIHGLPALLRQSQDVFDSTGGLHASALFSPGGELRILREDVGRHNALDKVIGASFLGGHLPLSRSILLVSGRASFELVQKAAVAGIPIFAAVGAPSSLAVELAQERGITLLGFVRDHRFNIYSGKERLKL